MAERRWPERSAVAVDAPLLRGSFASGAAPIDGDRRRSPSREDTSMGDTHATAATAATTTFGGGDAAPLDDADFAAAGAALGCDVAAIRAVAEVEAAGSGFFKAPDGRPKILFEAHLFSRFTKRKYDASHPAISSPTWNRALYKRGPAEYERLSAAMALDRKAALQSASWGKFQILGMHYGTCGCASVDDFVQAQCRSERAQLDAFVRFVIANPRMHAALRERRWDDFAYRYNGAGYKQNRYDEKLAAAYARHAAATP